MTAPEPDYYLLLGVSEAASEAEIRAAYRRAARACHPDTNPTDPRAAERFKSIRRAYDVLGNPLLRAQYRRPFRRAARPIPANSAARVEVETTLPREIRETIATVRIIARRARPRLERRFRQLIRYLESLDRPVLI